jgi:tetratricopeptide (TPR) repeat protein
VLSCWRPIRLRAVEKRKRKEEEMAAGNFQTIQTGKPSYKKCANCGYKNECYSRSFVDHNYRLTEWSDGESFQEVPSLKKTKLHKCGSCHQFYWNKRGLGGLSFDDYVQAAAYFEYEYSEMTLNNFINRPRNKKRLLHIRLKILQRYNDQLRIPLLSNGEPIKKTIPIYKKEHFTNNIKLLIDLLTDTKSNDYFLIAELYRNMGNFEKAKAALDKLSQSNKKEQLLKEIELKNRDVILIKHSKPA